MSNRAATRMEGETMARKTLEEQAQEIEIKLMQLELAATKAKDTTMVKRVKEALSSFRDY